MNFHVPIKGFFCWQNSTLFAVFVIIPCMRYDYASLLIYLYFIGWYCIIESNLFRRGTHGQGEVAVEPGGPGGEPSQGVHQNSGLLCQRLFFPETMELGFTFNKKNDKPTHV